MKIVLHIGMPKSGSTALQMGLHRNAASLQQHGVVYPSGDKYNLPKNHNILICAMRSAKRLPRAFKQIYSGQWETMRRDVEDFLTRVAERAVKGEAQILVLSGEMLFREMPPSSIAKLQEILRRLDPDGDPEIEVVAYVRRPADYYVSSMQQQLKASRNITVSKPVRYRAVLESYAPIAKTLTVVGYDRRTLHGGEINRDFLTRIAPDFGSDFRVKGLEKINAMNTTLSAEGMDLVHAYRSQNHPHSDRKFTSDTGEILRRLTALDAMVPGFVRPRPHEQVATYVDNSSVDLLWLRDRFGVAFADVDYDAIRSDLPPLAPPEHVGDVCAMDPTRRAALTDALLSDLSNTVDEGRGDAEADKADPLMRMVRTCTSDPNLREELTQWTLHAVAQRVRRDQPLHFKVTAPPVNQTAPTANQEKGTEPRSLSLLKWLNR